MSYEIIYRTFTVEKNGVFIPFVVMGSNNCWECRPGGNRRERNLFNAGLFFSGRSNFSSLDDMDKFFDKGISSGEKWIQEYLDGGMLQGKYKSPSSLLNSFKRYVFTSEELKLRPLMIDLYYVKLSDEQKKLVEKTFGKYLKSDVVLTDCEMDDIVKKVFSELPDDIVKILDDYFSKSGRRSWICYSHMDAEYKIEWAFKEKYPSKRKKPKTTYEIIQELKDKPFSEFKEESIPGLLGKTLLVFDGYKNLLSDKGKIRPLNAGGFGFFKARSKRYYTPLYNIKFYKIVG